MSFPPLSAPVAASCGRRRVVIHLRGIVQGVGFRPYVHRLAVAESLGGTVRNAGGEVVVEAEGAVAAVGRFLARLPQELPAAARIDDCRVEETAPIGEAVFSIASSVPTASDDMQAAEQTALPIAPDLATCADCWAEFHDRQNRRYRYPFLNCTQCGPRYTIVTGVPYDRVRTTMARFAMCAACQREYEDAGDRRFHAEPTACAACGPQLMWQAVIEGVAREAASHTAVLGSAALECALAVLRAGGIIAAKGLGGYHLLCDAQDERAVARLRRDKDRPHKPLAVLVASVADARRVVQVDAVAAGALMSPAHPIVLLTPQVASGLADGVAPGLDQVGVMLPAMPLHALLAECGPLVCTSGNLSEEPMAWRDADAMTRLAPLVDGVLTHDREIVLPCDDSVVQIDHSGAAVPLRRARGFAPLAIRVVPGSRRDGADRGTVLAVGAELKSAAALLQAGRLTLSPHLGDVASPETLEALSLAVKRLETSLGATPDVVACDAHPGYLSSLWAAARAARDGVPLVRVQHHHAHLASLQAEAVARGALAPDVELAAFTFDGTGYGEDGTIWGGEFLRGGAAGFERLASLQSFLLPGGDVAVKHPWRIVLGVLDAVDRMDAAPMVLSPHVPLETLSLVRQQLERRVACTRTSSMGRWFDACAVLCGVTPHNTYEGQAAMQFEALASRCMATARAPRYRFRLTDGVLDGTPVIHALLDDVAHLRSRGVARATPAFAELAWGVHAAVADAMYMVAACHAPADPAGAERVVGLTGGVFQNRLLTQLAVQRLETAGFTVLTHRLVPCNDGGLALGQATVAAHQYATDCPTS
ncbi:MAG: carbamoyltransferase HypF [Gemmatimonas sp.]|uniref:carbamoyltransferase HypF n=1 Tax=Gemmatimonas sp. UBA7669 TaxID=1946568 RepID=UPI0025C0EE81|nr:carbamoyltransferase HypF [Gemmatimonas sp. UBA7669]MBA3917245.1 carbamoyltransferase HypF [Gemmatimonas sp.]